MNSKNKNNRILLIAVGLVLAAILAFSLSACSLFADSITGLFSGTNQQTLNSSDGSNGNKEQGEEQSDGEQSGGEQGGKENQGEQGGSGEQGNGSQSGNEQGGEQGSGEQGSGNSGGEQGGNEQGGEQGSGSQGGSGSQSGGTHELHYVSFTSPLVYDKASESDFSISATHEDMHFQALFGAGLTSETIATTTNRYGASAVAIDGEYLCTLPSGFYELCYAVMDQYEACYYDYFTIQIKNTNAKPQDVKIDYDISCPNVYVTFTCDCGGRHTVTYDGSEKSLSAGVMKVQITSPGDKRNKHTATVKCSGGTSSVEKASPPNAVASGNYLTNTYSFMGHTADKYIEDKAEFVDFYQYLIYEGANTEMQVGVSSSVLSQLQNNGDAYLASIQSSLTIPWSCGISCRSGSDSIVTCIVGNVNAGNSISSGYTNSDQYDPAVFSTHYSLLGEREYGSPLPIDSKQGVSVRNMKELLAVAEAGYRPIATGDALTVYNKARNFCTVYLSDSMSEIEKLHVIYDYLAGSIKYDNSVLNLYVAVGALSGYDNVTSAKNFINLELAKASNEFSLSMHAAVKAIVDDNSIDTVKKLKDALKENYLQRLSAFSAEGVFNDGAAVCEGISYAFMLLARIEGIECYQITGYATNGASPVAHAWNKVRIDGKWYAVDATWGNYKIDRNKGGDPDVVKFVSHRYFMVDESLFYDTHKEFIKNAQGVVNVASENVNYYQGVVTTKGHSLYIENDQDLLEAVRYYVNGESRYMEFESSPEYQITSSKVLEALTNILHSSVSISYSSGKVFLVYYTVS